MVYQYKRANSSKPPASYLQTVSDHNAGYSQRKQDEQIKHVSKEIHAHGFNDAGEFFWLTQPLSLESDDSRVIEEGQFGISPGNCYNRPNW